VQVIIIIIVID